LNEFGSFDAFKQEALCTGLDEEEDEEEEDEDNLDMENVEVASIFTTRSQQIFSEN
jgi:hypothetical protein